jgi:hypothetical protein
MPAARRRFRCQTDNQGLFPGVCAKSGKWFHPAGELFRRARRTKQFPEKFNDFDHIRPTEPGGGAVAHRLIAAIIRGAGVRDDLWVRGPVRLFNLSLVNAGQADHREPKHRCGLLNQTTCNFSGQLALGSPLQQRIAVVGHDNIDVGNNPTRKPGRPIVERSAESTTGARIRRQNPLKTERPICGAMSQQYGDSNRGNESAPQKLVQLVGCRDPKARSEPWVRPLPSPAKR